MKTIRLLTLGVAVCTTAVIYAQVPSVTSSGNPGQQNGFNNQNRLPQFKSAQRPVANQQQGASGPVTGWRQSPPPIGQPANPFGQTAPTARTFRSQTAQSPRFPNSQPAVASGFFRDAVAPRSRGTSPAVESKLQAYKKAKEKSEKEAIEQELKELLNKQFDDRMKGPQERVEWSRNRLEELTEQISYRKSKSDEIIDLRLKVITYQTIGLGWGTSTHSSAHPAPLFYSNFAPNGVPAPSEPQSFPRVPGVSTTHSFPVPHTVPGKARQTAGFEEQVTGRPTIEGKAANEKETQPVPMHELLRDYKTAKDDDERKRISKVLRERLETEFGLHQDQLKRSADKIEEQITSIEDNIAKRKKAKKEIVDLQLKMLINQANGLGF